MLDRQLALHFVVESVARAVVTMADAASPVRSVRHCEDVLRDAMWRLFHAAEPDAIADERTWVLFGRVDKSLKERARDDRTERFVTLLGQSAWMLAQLEQSADDGLSEAELVTRFRKAWHSTKADRFVTEVLAQLEDAGLARGEGIRAARRRYYLNVDGAAFTAAVEQVVLLGVATHCVTDIDQLRGLLQLSGGAVDELVGGMVARGVLVAHPDGRLAADGYRDVPFELSVADHVAVVCDTIRHRIAKLQEVAGDRHPITRDLLVPNAPVGFRTWRFVVWDGHPLQDEVESLMIEFDRRAESLWARCSDLERDLPADAASLRRLCLYAGQHFEHFEPVAAPRGPDADGEPQAD